MAPPATIGDRSNNVSLKTNQNPYELVSPTWSTANSAASLAGASRADQLTEPQDNATTGEYRIVPQPGSYLLLTPILRGAASAIARGEVLTINLWTWRQKTVRAVPTSTTDSNYAASIVQWTPRLIGRWTCSFNGTGSAGNNTLGVSGGNVLATDIYCSNFVVVTGYDKSGDYANLWYTIQPSADDGSAAILMADGLGGSLLTVEGRTTTNGTAFNFEHSWLSGA